MNKYKKALGIIGLSIMLVCLGSVSGWAITISEIRTFIDGLPIGDFNNSDTDEKASVQRELETISDTLLNFSPLLFS